MSPDLTQTFSQLCEEVLSALSRGNSAEVSRYLAGQRDFLVSHREEIDEATIETLWASQQKAIRLAKIRRARILETIEANKRSLGVLHAYQVATTL